MTWNLRVLFSYFMSTISSLVVINNRQIKKYEKYKYHVQTRSTWNWILVADLNRWNKISYNSLSLCLQAWRFVYQCRLKYIHCKIVVKLDPIKNLYYSVIHNLDLSIWFADWVEIHRYFNLRQENERNGNLSPWRCDISFILNAVAIGIKHA